MSHVRTFAVAALCAASLFAATPARATTIDLVTGTPCSGTMCGPLNGLLTLTAVGGNFEYKTFNGATGLGVSNATGGEIDINEAINGTFSTAQVLQSFRVLFFYNGPEFGDPNEVAKLTINGGAAFGTLTATTENTAVWSLGGPVTSCGATTTAGTGCFDVMNPFGSTLVSNLSFTALSSPGGINNNSDYSLASVGVSAVPEPTSLVLFGSGLGALVRRLRKKRAA